MGRRPELTVALLAGIGLILIGFTVMPHLLFLIPACVALAGVTLGSRSAIWLTICFSLLAVGLAGETGWLVPFLCLSGFSLARGLKSRREPLEIIIITGAVMAAGVIAWLAVGVLLSGESLREGLGIWLQEMRAELLSDIAGLPRDEQEAVLQRFDLFLQLVWPASVLLSMLFGAGINYVAARWVVQRFAAAHLADWPPFSHWRLPWGYSWGVIGGLGALLLSEAAGPQFGPGLAAIGLNLSMVSSTVFLVQGLAVVWYWLSRTGMGRGLRLALVLFSLFTVFLPPVITLIGVFDCWFDWRRLEKRGKADKAGKAGSEGGKEGGEAGEQGRPRVKVETTDEAAEPVEPVEPRGPGGPVGTSCAGSPGGREKSGGAGAASSDAAGADGSEDAGEESRGR